MAFTTLRPPRGAHSWTSRHSASDLILAQWVLWVQMSEEAKGRSGDFEGLCLMVLSALVSLSAFHYHFYLQGDALPGLQPSPKGTL